MGAVVTGTEQDVQFKHPPVVEVALSVQFDALSRLDGPRIGLYWSHIKDRYPAIEEHPRLDPIRERLDTPDFAARYIRIAVGETVPRYWFLNRDESALLQVQQDRFIHNWKKNVKPYPRYENLRQTFADELRSFTRFLSDEGIGSPVPNQCEVTYINHIDAVGQPAHAGVDQVLTVWLNRYNDGPRPSSESADVRLRYLISHEGQPVGRLHLELQPAFRQGDKRPIWVLILTARGAPLSPDLEGTLAFLDVGRRHMLDTFLAITPRERHEEWEIVG